MLQVFGEVSQKASNKRSLLCLLNQNLMQIASYRKGKRWLDLGAGCGLLSMLLSHLGADYVLATDLFEVT